MLLLSTSKVNGSKCVRVCGCVCVCVCLHSDSIGWSWGQSKWWFVCMHLTSCNYDQMIWGVWCMRLWAKQFKGFPRNKPRIQENFCFWVVKHVESADRIWCFTSWPLCTLVSNQEVLVAIMDLNFPNLAMGAAKWAWAVHAKMTCCYKIWRGQSMTEMYGSWHLVVPNLPPCAYQSRVPLKSPKKHGMLETDNDRTWWVPNGPYDYFPRLSQD